MQCRYLSLCLSTHEKKEVEQNKQITAGHLASNKFGAQTWAAHTLVHNVHALGTVLFSWYRGLALRRVQRRNERKHRYARKCKEAEGKGHFTVLMGAH